jgi:hypothetical protein
LKIINFYYFSLSFGFQAVAFCVQLRRVVANDDDNDEDDVYIFEAVCFVFSLLPLLLLL